MDNENQEIVQAKTDEEIFQELLEQHQNTLGESQSDTPKFTGEPTDSAEEEQVVSGDNRPKKPSQNARYKEKNKQLQDEVEYWRAKAHETAMEASNQAVIVKNAVIAKMASDFDLVAHEEKNTEEVLLRLLMHKNEFLSQGDAEKATEAETHIKKLELHQADLRSRKDSITQQYLHYNSSQVPRFEVQQPQPVYTEDNSAVESFYKHYPFADSRGRNPNFSPVAAAKVSELVKNLTTEYKLQGKGEEVLNHNFMAEIEQRVQKEFNLKPIQGGASMRGAPIEKRTSVTGDVSVPTMSMDEKRFLTSMADEFGLENTKDIMNAFRSAKNGFETTPNYDDI